MPSASSSRRIAVPDAEHAALGFFALLVTFAWTFVAGKDASWDVYNHHLYLPFSLLSGRYETDLFAAGPQSYQNPLGYIPFYLLVKAELPSWLVGAALVTLHTVLIAWPLSRIVSTIWSDPGDRGWRWMAFVAAWCAPVFLIVAGTSSIDPLGAGLALIAAAAVLDRKPTRRMLILGGAAVGLAVAIKPTSAVFAIASGTLLLFRYGLNQVRLRDFWLFCATCIVSLVISNGFWASWLWLAFHNPIFPLYNHIFNSPFIPPNAAAASRFVPTEITGFVSRIWQMVEFRSYVTTEAFVPDLRPIAAALASLALAGLAIVRRGPRALLQARMWTRADAQLGILIVVSYPLWMAITGNARYAVAWFILIGIAMVRAFQLVLPSRYAKIALGVVLSIQILVYTGVGQRRYVGEPWDSEPYFAVAVPPMLRDQPFLHLSLGVQTFASVATYLNPRGALINTSGQFTLPAEGPLGEAVKERLAKWQGRTRVLFQAPPHFEDSETMETVRQRMRNLLYRFGLAIDWTDCEVIWIGYDRKQLPSLTVPQTEKASSPLLSCNAAPRPQRDLELEAQLARADQVFDLLQAHCPAVFGPPPLASDIGDGVVQRRYVNTDVRVNVSPSKGVSLAHFRSLNTVTLGTIDEVIASEGRDACSAWEKLWQQ
ncbi:MAG: hypothetical protein LC119_02315 [Burkholderiales bacterium]|nr:hypothetical protein [Burkholderiales bacterium]